jgi:hypothetical protein
MEDLARCTRKEMSPQGNSNPQETKLPADEIDGSKPGRPAVKPHEGGNDTGWLGEDEGAEVLSDACAGFVRALAGWAARNELRERARRAASTDCSRDRQTTTRTITLEAEEYRFES